MSSPDFAPVFDLQNKLSGPLSAIVNQHKAPLIDLLKGSSGELSRNALKNDGAVRTVAIYCYALLPGLVRLAVKEPAFVNFVMAQRETILAKLVASDESTNAPASDKSTVC